MSAFAALISGFATSDTIDLGGYGYTSAATRAFTQTGASGTLTVSTGGKVANLTLVGGYAISNFALSNDGAGGTFVKYTA